MENGRKWNNVNVHGYPKLKEQIVFVFGGELKIGCLEQYREGFKTVMRWKTYDSLGKYHYNVVTLWRPIRDFINEMDAICLRKSV